MSCILLGLITVMLVANADVHHVYKPFDKMYRRSMIGGYMLSGSLAADGTFVPFLTEINNRKQLFRSSRELPELLFAKYQSEKVYEYRSGKLVPMLIDRNLVLIPEVDQSIIDINDYQWSMAARRIYNLPGYFEIVNVEKSIPNTRRIKPTVLTNASSSTDGTDYVFVQDESIRYRHVIGNYSVVGTIDSKGTFIPDWDTLNSKFGLIGGPSILIDAKTPNEKVYEYRSKVLVPMFIDENKKLIPEVGGKIIDFKDYQYFPTARRIYNLPGRFVLKSDIPEKKR